MNERLFTDIKSTLIVNLKIKVLQFPIKIINGKYNGATAVANSYRKIQ